jgi:hypothetical protein
VVFLFVSSGLNRFLSLVEHYLSYWPQRNARMTPGLPPSQSSRLLGIPIEFLLKGHAS